MINYYWELTIVNYNNCSKTQRIIVEAISDEEAQNILSKIMPSAVVVTIKKKHYSHVYAINTKDKWFEIKGSITTTDFFSNKEKNIKLIFLSQGKDSDCAKMNCANALKNSFVPIEIVDCKEKKITEVILK